MLRLIFWLLFIVTGTWLKAQQADLTSFIDRYKEIAVEEMHRTGIPASIKLAQAILESSAGNSKLATKSNNFFGIKCGPEWDGPTYYKKDDDVDHRGRLIPSCFRVFNTPESSYIAHSAFLTNPNKAYRYGWLFNLDKRDYKSWAWGLKESGYATNPKYAVLLIDLIERYELYSYDYYDPRPLLASTNATPREKPKVLFKHRPIERKNLRTTTGRHRPIEKVTIIDGIVRNNGLDMAYAHAGETPLIIAEKYGRSLKNILAYNEKLTSNDQELGQAERVYFHKKKRAYRGSRKYHNVQPGETMYQISQIYGIKLAKLYTRNRMYPGSEPMAGEPIKLRGMVKSKDRPKVRKVPQVYVQTKQSSRKENKAKEKVNAQSMHVVKRGETLYAIAGMYEQTVEDLLKRNELSTNLIKPGQILYID
ncbi:MAG: LysM peptidoglycan-binding domain-containing protein [Saprospiraceae bacterium]|nr:LysM peptidoglycan-binding domain-containing protein [Saprospiraceae bacterium]